MVDWAATQFVDTFFSSKKAKSIREYKSYQVFVTEFGHVFVVLMENKSGKILR